MKTVPLYFRRGLMSKVNDYSNTIVLLRSLLGDLILSGLLEYKFIRR